MVKMSVRNKIWPANDEDEELTREVYARFGLAMYMSQVLEHGIVNALLVLQFFATRTQYSKIETWQSAFDKFYDDQFAKTFGNLLRALSSLKALPPLIIQKLEKSKTTRDFLAHSFFRQNDFKFLTQDGRLEMIDFCENAVEEFKAVDNDLESFCAPIRQQFGITDDWIEKRYQELLSGRGTSKS
jgi:hypothetical protein